MAEASLIFNIGSTPDNDGHDPLAMGLSQCGRSSCIDTFIAHGSGQRWAVWKRSYLPLE